MNTDLSFITNEENQTLKERFEVLIKDTSFFDCLVGYFYTSGFHAIYQSLEHTEKIRILSLKHELTNPFKVLAALQTHIPMRLLEGHYAEKNPAAFGRREVILSLYLSDE
jgi:hypothetical protein